MCGVGSPVVGSTPQTGKRHLARELRLFYRGLARFTRFGTFAQRLARRLQYAPTSDCVTHSFPREVRMRSTILACALIASACGAGLVDGTRGNDGDAGFNELSACPSG